MIARLLLLAAVQLTDPDSLRLRVELAVDEVGEASPRWLAVLRRRLPAAAYDSVAALRRPLAAEERQWAGLIVARRAAWEAEIPGIARLFAPIAPPVEAVVVLGNRGGEDAFTHDSLTIGFDLAALHRVYGAAGTPDTPARIDRLFRHEYAHIMQKRWLAAHPYPAGTPLRDAIAEIWAEGLGVWYSMSDRWRSRGGRPSLDAKRALQRLEPRLAGRLAALRCASAEAADTLTADLSFGPFEEKWGALPAALWLESEAAASPEAPRRFVVGGPDEVWRLAERRLPPELRRAVREARGRGECPGKP